MTASDHDGRGHDAPTAEPERVDRDWTRPWRVTPVAERQEVYDRLHLFSPAGDTAAHSLEILAAPSAAEPSPVCVAGDVSREALGRLVREVWVAWAKEQDSPKDHWLSPWEELPEPMREVDRRIGEAVARRVLATTQRARHGAGNKVVHRTAPELGVGVVSEPDDEDANRPIPLSWPLVHWPTGGSGFYDPAALTAATASDTEEALVEALADLEHDRWSRWEKWRAANNTPENNKRWRFQRRIPYRELTEESKESDRKEARQTIALLKRHGVLIEPAGVCAADGSCICDADLRHIAHVCRVVSDPSLFRPRLALVGAMARELLKRHGVLAAAPTAAEPVCAACQKLKADLAATDRALGAVCKQRDEYVRRWHRCLDEGNAAEPGDTRPLPDGILRNAIEFARGAYLNDGAEGETIHLLCRELELRLDKGREVATPRADERVCADSAVVCECARCGAKVTAEDIRATMLCCSPCCTQINRELAQDGEGET